jgi:dienelactone hydrolase
VCALICHFANKDDWCTPTKVNELEAALKQSKSQFELYRYDAQHAFMNEARPQVYDAVSAKTACEDPRLSEKDTRVDAHNSLYIGYRHQLFLLLLW